MPMAVIFFSIFESVEIILAGTTFFQQQLHVASFKFRDGIFILKLSTTKFDYSLMLYAIVTIW